MLEVDLFEQHTKLIAGNCNARCTYNIGRLIAWVLMKLGIIQPLLSFIKIVCMFFWGLLQLIAIILGYCLIFVLPTFISLSLVGVILGTEYWESSLEKTSSRQEEIIAFSILILISCIILKFVKQWLNLNEYWWHLALYISVGFFILAFITNSFKIISQKIQNKRKKV